MMRFSKINSFQFEMAILLCELLSMLLAPNAQAESPLVVSVNRELGAFASGLLQDYRETDPVIGTLDSEHGWVPGFGVKASTLTDVFQIQNVYAGVLYRYNNGTVSYSGSSVSMPSIHLSSPSGEIVNNVGAEVGKGLLFLSGNLLILPVFQGEYRQWKRTIPNGFSPEEDYVYFAVGTAIRGDYAVTNRLVVTGKIGWEYMINPTNQAAANPRIDKPGNLLSLGERPIYQVSIGADYRLTEHMHTFLGLDFSQFSFGESPPAYYFVNGHRRYELEPPSATKDLLLQLGAAWAF